MDINTTTIFITVALAHFVALLSPGPDFLLVVKSAVRNKKQVAIGVALGIASANAVYIALCLAGVGAILASSITIMTAIKFAGGVFLTYLAVMALKAKKSDYAFLIKSAEAEDTKESTLPKEFLIGFASGILNPQESVVLPQFVHTDTQQRSRYRLQDCAWCLDDLDRIPVGLVYYFRPVA